MVILRQNLPGYDAISPYDVVLNTQDGLLYWSDAKRNVISGMHLDGTNIGVIVNDSIQKPRHLAVASEHRLICSLGLFLLIIACSCQVKFFYYMKD